MTEQEEIALYEKHPKDYAEELVEEYKKLFFIGHPDEINEKAKEAATMCIQEMYKLPIFRCWSINPSYLVKVEEEIKKL